MTKQKFLIVVGVLFLALVVAVLPFTAGCAPAPTVPTPGAWSPPEGLAMSAYAYGTSGNAYSLAITEAVGKATGHTIRVIPSGTDAGRISALLSGKAQFLIMSSASAFPAGVGAYEFSDPGWGPVAMEMVYCGKVAVVNYVRGDSGIETLYDMKGKKVPFVDGTPANVMMMQATLAFGNLTWDDVEIVRVSSYHAGAHAPLKGTADMFYGSSVSPVQVELQASPHGIHWLETPADDTEGWARYKEVAPFVAPYYCALGIDASEENPKEIYCMSYPICMVKGSDPELGYWMTKWIDETYDEFKDVFPGCEFFSLEEQAKWAESEPPWPYNAGSVKYFKEKGLWTDEMEQWNQRALATNDKLVEAWDKLDKQAKTNKWSTAERQEHWYDMIEEIVGWRVVTA